MKIDTTAAIEAAVRACPIEHAECKHEGCGHSYLSPLDPYAVVRAVLDAALPHLARAVREALLSPETAHAVVASKFGHDIPLGAAQMALEHASTVLTAAVDHVFGPAEQEKK